MVARRGGAKHISKSKHTKIYVRSTFGSWDAEVEKSARGCGAKHISKSKCAKHTLLSEHFWKFTRHCGAKQMSKSTCQKTPQVRNAFGDWDVEKVRTIVARSTLPSPNVKNTPCLKHFWKLRRWKREANLEVKMRTEPNVWTIEKKVVMPEKAHAVVKGSKIRNENDKSTTCLDYFWRLRGQQSARMCTLLWFHLWTMRCRFYTALHHASPHYTTIATTTAIIIITLQLQLQLQLQLRLQLQLFTLYCARSHCTPTTSTNATALATAAAPTAPTRTITTTQQQVLLQLHLQLHYNHAYNYI